MKYSLIYTRMFFILVFLFSGVKAQTLTITNNTGNPIVEHTDDDNLNKYLPQNCQKQYFQEKYNYLEHINGHNKGYYKKVLREKFNEE